MVSAEAQAICCWPRTHDTLMALFDSESLIIAGISLLSLFACCSLVGLWLYTRLNPDTLDSKA